MHKKTYSIIKNLGFSDEVIKDIKAKQKPPSKKLLASLKKLGLPDGALKQIKQLENINTQQTKTPTNNELIKSLVKRCKRSLDAFANKKIIAKIVFSQNNWTIYCDVYSKDVEKLHTVCKPYFDQWASQGVNVSFYFDGSNSWKVIVNKKEDLPTNDDGKKEK